LFIAKQAQQFKDILFTYLFINSICFVFRDIYLEPFKLETIPFGPYNLGKYLFGDGLIYLVFTPGHTPGHLSVLLRVANGGLLLASDVGYAEKSWKELILPGYNQ